MFPHHRRVLHPIRLPSALYPKANIHKFPPPPGCPSLQTGSNSPSILPSPQQRELLELAVKGCKSLGLQIVSGRLAGSWAGPAACPALPTLLARAGPTC